MLKISVVMPVYNSENYLSFAIDSILEQTFTDFEFIIVDDGSTDNSRDVVKSFKDKRIMLVELNHSGIVSALNKGIELSTGEYIVRMDSDDISIPERLESLVDYMEKNSDIAMCGSWASLINKSSEKIGVMEFPKIENKDIKRQLFLSCPFIHPSVIIRKEVLNKVGLYKNFRYVEDYELWTRVLSKSKAHNLPLHLINYRIHEKQITKIKSITIRRLIGIWIRILAIIRY